MEASLQLPQALFTQASTPGQPDDLVYKLHLLGFRNGKFFPSTGNSSQLADGGKRRSVATPVIMAKLGEASALLGSYVGRCTRDGGVFPPEGMPLHVLRTPVNITLRRLAHGSDAVSASWNVSLVGGQGGWQSDGCRVLGHYDNFTTISCNSLGNYGLLMVGGGGSGGGGGVPGVRHSVRVPPRRT